MIGFEDYGRSNKKPEGFLIGTKQLEVLGRARVGDVLTVSVFKYAKYGDFGIIKGSVCRGADVLAQGEVKVFRNKI